MTRGDSMRAGLAAPAASKAGGPANGDATRDSISAMVCATSAAAIFSHHATKGASRASPWRKASVVTVATSARFPATPDAMEG
ncbi:MAG: hypothetical protein WAV82_01230 [Methylobacter sp.]